MITGSMSLNNLNNAQVAKVLEAETEHGDKLAIDVPQIRQFQAGMNVSGVSISWNDEAGCGIALDLVGGLIAQPESVSKAQ